MEFKICDALFRARKPVGPDKINVGLVGTAGIGISKYRDVASITGPKMSYALVLFDRMLESAGTISAFQNTTDKSIVCFFDGGDPVIVRTEGPGKISYTTGINVAEGTSLSKKVIPAVIYALTEFAELDELTQQFEEIIKQAEKARSTREAAFAFADSFYYGFAKHNEVIDVEIEEGKSLDAQLQAAFRSGLFQPIPILEAHKKYFGKSPYASKKSADTKAKKASTGDFLSDCKAGKYKVLYDWPEELKKKIVSKKFLDTYEPVPEFEELVRKIKYHADKIVERMDMGLTGAEAIGKDAQNILILGKPGTGKTTLIHALSAALEMPVCTTVHSKHTEEDEYEGKTKIIDGHPEFVETDSLLFHQKGGIDINEEINLADPSVTMGGLGQKLEYPYIVKKNGYETIVRHPLNIVIATMNVGTNGSNPLNQALANRFRTPFTLDDPTRATFIDILKKATSEPEEICVWVYDAYEKVVNFLSSPEVGCEEIVQNLSIRTCIGAIENMNEGMSSTRALINSIVGAIAVVDLETARKVRDEVIESLPPCPIK